MLRRSWLAEFNPLEFDRRGQLGDENLIIA